MHSDGLFGHDFRADRHLQPLSGLVTTPVSDRHIVNDNIVQETAAHSFNWANPAADQFLSRAENIHSAARWAVLKPLSYRWTTITTRVPRVR